MKQIQGRLSVVAVIGTCVMLLAAGRTHSVSITGTNFSPGSLNVSAGDTVTWTNNDDRDHAIAADDGAFNSGKLGTGASFSHSFPKTGRYAYGCKFHPREKGSVSVAD